MARRHAVMLALCAAAAVCCALALGRLGAGGARAAADPRPPAAAEPDAGLQAELLAARADEGREARATTQAAEAAPVAPTGGPRGADVAATAAAPGARAAPAPADAEAPDQVVRGRLRSRRGEWDDFERLLAGNVRFELLSEGAAGPARVARLERLLDPSGEVMLGFSFEPVPDGAYVLSSSTSGTERIEPARLALRTPVPPLDLWCVDDVETSALGFRVLDGETLAVLDEYSVWSVHTEIDAEAGVLFHAGPLKLDAPVGASFRWRLWAPGYRPAAGDERAFAPEPDGRLVAEVRLERGFGRRFVVLGRDPAMRPLPGARLFLDGAPAGETDAEGALEVALPAAPRAFRATLGELEASGTVPSEAAAAGRAMTTVIVLERPRDR